MCDITFVTPLTYDNNNYNTKCDKLACFALHNSSIIGVVCD